MLITFKTNLLEKHLEGGLLYSAVDVVHIVQ